MSELTPAGAAYVRETKMNRCNVTSTGETKMCLYETEETKMSTRTTFPTTIHTYPEFREACCLLTEIYGDQMGRPAVSFTEDPSVVHLEFPDGSTGLFKKFVDCWTFKADTEATQAVKFEVANNKDIIL